MEFPAFQAELGRMGGIVQALAAIGAMLRLRALGQAGHPAVQPQLAAAVDALVPGALDGLTPDQVAVAFAYVTQQFQQSSELFHNPDRAPGWAITDPAMLQSQGRGSRQIFRNIFELGATRPSVAATFGGRFLDVGTGVAGISLEAAQLCPELRVVGLDIWEPALVLARANVAASPHAARIEIRAQDVTRLDETAAYSLAWLPTGFMPRPVAEAALDRFALALAPGGYAVLGVYVSDVPDQAGDALAALRTVRTGGHVWSASELEQQLRARGFVDVETCPAKPAYLIIGRRP